MKNNNTFTATIYIGAKEGYDGIVHTYEEAENILQEYCNTISFCVTLNETEFIYKDGKEKGFIVGLINYPRFPEKSVEITRKALVIARKFVDAFKQNRISVVCSDRTYLIERTDYA